MVAALSLPPDFDEDRLDQRVFLHGKRFREYEALLAIRGERSTPRIHLLDGTIEIMSPSLDHEAIKSMFARLVFAFAEEREIDVNGYGSWTLKRRARERAVEPDECFVLGGERKKAPDIVVEVEWTGGGLDKLELFRTLGVREVWIWRQRRGTTVHALRDERYVVVPRSELLPGFDFEEVEPYLLAGNQAKAIREYRARLRGTKVRSGRRSQPR